MKSSLFPIVFIICLIIFSGCGKKEASGTGIYFDTVVDIRICDGDADKLLAECFDICEEMEDVFSAQKEGSELYRMNHRGSDMVEVSDDLASCIKAGLCYGRISDGAFDITVLPLRELWDFESENPSVPSESEIEEALQKVDYRKVHCEGNTITFDDSDTQIDLGGIAKGYISAKLKAYLLERGCKCALINLGGNVSAVGRKTDGSEWNVGIQDPFAERGSVFDTVQIDNKCVVSSGTYERYFTVDGRKYHHILDPDTGYPAETGLQQATVIGTDDVLCDALSTVCVLMGEDKASKLIENEALDVEVFLIDKNNEGRWLKD